MIASASDLNVALEQLGKFTDTLEAMRRHAEQTDSRVFPVLSQVYINRIREIHDEIRAYLQAPAIPNEDARESTSVLPSRS
jgi:hypothetical protein